MKREGKQVKKDANAQEWGIGEIDELSVITN